MLWNEKNKWWYVLLATVMLFPFFMICFYAFPTADDYCASNYLSRFPGIFSPWKNLYHDYNGRFSANFILLFSPMKTTYGTNYNWWIFGQLTLFFLTSLMLTKKIIHYINAQTPYSIIAILITAVMLFSGMQHISEGFYWLTGSTAYLGGNIFLLFYLLLLLRLLEYQSLLNRILLIIVLIFAGGFNEVQTITLCIIHFVVFLYYIKRKNQQWKFLLLLFIITLITAMVMLTSTGNITRINQYQDNFGWWYSAGMSALQTGRFLLLWTINPVYLVGMFMLIHYFSRQQIHLKKIPGKNLLLAILLIQLYLSNLLPYLGTGILGQHRTINWAFVNFIFISVFLAIQLSEKYRSYQISFTPSAKKILPLFFLISYALTGNGRNAWSDLFSGEAMKYHREMSDRSALLMQQADDIQRINAQPATLFTFDVSNHSEDWIKDCTRQYYIRVSNQTNAVSQGK